MNVFSALSDLYQFSIKIEIAFGQKEDEYIGLTWTIISFDLSLLLHPSYGKLTIPQQDLSKHRVTFLISWWLIDRSIL